MSKINEKTALLNEMNNAKRRKKYFYNIDFIKAIGALLIINSHMDTIYPIASMATGGALGNSLFFISSGYLIRGKEKKVHYFISLFLKLYLPYYLITAITGLVPGRNLFYQFLWPTNYWFIGAIVLFYILYTVFENNNDFKWIIAFMIISILLYFLVYVCFLDTSEWVVESNGLYDIKTYFKLIYYFAIMIIGGYLRDIQHSSTLIKWAHFIWPISVIAMYLLKYIISANQELMHFQFLSQAFTFVFAVSFLLASEDSKIVEYSKAGKNLAKIIKHISACSLEMYLVQFIMIDLASRCFGFPLSLFMAIILIFCSSYLLYRINKIILLLIEKTIKI